MAGHNKWSKIKNTKGSLDAKRGKLFTKLGKELAIAARLGGGDPDGNPRLRQAMTAARAASMPKDNIDRAVKKGTGELVGDAMEEHTYEGYGPGGVAILVETTSDNKNRTVADLRNLFKSGGGSIADMGSVSFLFSHHGQLLFEKGRLPEDVAMEIAIDAGADDVIQADDSVEVLTAVSDVYKVKEKFERVGMHPTHVGFRFVPKTTVPIHNEDTAKRLLAMIEVLEDHDDVQRVHSNFDIDDRTLAEALGQA